MIKYCKQCLFPDTKPDLVFDTHGVCNACTAYKTRDPQSYLDRQKTLPALIESTRKRNKTRWDCVIPVSGGKDSTYQVIKAKELGLNPLCVTSTTCDESELGRKNIQNLQRLGVDHIQVSPNPKVRARLNKLCLEQVGDISWPEHVGIFTIPVRVAVDFGIPLIMWGENSQHEYGGPAVAQENSVLDRRWLEEFGGLLGLRVSDLVGQDGIEEKDLELYTYPSDEDLKRVGVTGFFLGYFFPWDGLTNAIVATAHGFNVLPTGVVEGSMVNYENLDNHQTGIHDYFKFLKFGFGRTTDIANLYIRRGRITREEGLAMIKMHDGKFPATCLGKPLQDILAPLDMSVDQFVAICDRYTNKRLFKRNPDGSLKKDKWGNLEKSNYDNA